MKVLKNAGSFELLTPEKELRKMLNVIEHSFLTVKFLGVSRGFTHEMVRHRLASYSQESTRYVDYVRRGGGADLDRFQLCCIVPPHRDEEEKVPLKDGRNVSLVDMFTEIEMYYRALRKTGWRPQDARQVLPIGIRAEIVVSANLREWRHIFAMRTSKAAHWEIRSVMCDLLSELKRIIPPVFADFCKFNRYLNYHHNTHDRSSVDSLSSVG